MVEAEITNRNPLDIKQPDVKRIARSVLGYEGFMARKVLSEHTRDISSNITTENLVQKLSSRYSNTLYIRAWVYGVPFGAYLMSLAKQPKIKNHLAQQRSLLSSGGASRKARNMTMASLQRDATGNVVYDEKGNAKRNYTALTITKSSEKVTSTRISKKTGQLKTTTKYKYYSTAYQSLSSSKLSYYESGVLRFLNKNGQWKTIREAVIGGRHPEYKNWLVDRWQSFGEKNEGIQQKVADRMDKYMQEELDKIAEKEEF